MGIKRYRRHIRHNRKSGFLYLFLAVIVGSMSLGYAYLSDDLSIEGRTNLHNATWNVHLENVQPVSGSVEAITAPTISEDTHVSFAAHLNNPAEFYAFTVDIVNAGTIDAMVDSFAITPELTEDQAKYLSYKITYLDGSPITTKQRLAGLTTETLKVSFEYIDGVDLTYYPSTNQNLSVAFSIHYEQADETTESVRFSDDDWAKIVSNVHNGTLPACYRVGSTKEVNLGTLGIHQLRIVNKSTPEECEQSGFSQTACGFVLEFTDSLSKRNIAGSHNGGGWPASEFPTYLNNIIYNSLPTELKNGVISTYVVSGHGGLDAHNFTSNDKLFLFSRREIFGYDGEEDTGAEFTRQLDYYENGGTLIKNYQNVSNPWWLRSIDVNSTNTYDSVSAIGEYGTTTVGSNIGVAPAFRIG